MKRFESVQEPVQKLTGVVCDLCGKEAEKDSTGYPEFYDKNGDRFRGQLWMTIYGLDEAETHELDLCGGCGEWLIGQIREKKIRREVIP